MEKNRRDFTSAKAKETLLPDKEENWCGECCWFCFETTDGDGQCVEVGEDGYPMMMTRCDSRACEKFVSIKEMRHHMAVLLQSTRWDEDVEFIHYSPNGDEETAAKKFAYKYMKMFSKL